MAHPIQRLFALLFFVIVLLLGFEFGEELIFYTAHPASLRADLLPYHTIAPLIMIGIQILSILFVPISDQGITIANGVLFGTFLGSIVSYVGRIIGSVCAFFLGRQLGTPLMEYFLNKNEVNHFNEIIAQKGEKPLYGLYMIPFFPSDVISFTAGISKMRFSKFFKIISIGFIPHVILIAGF